MIGGINRSLDQGHHGGGRGDIRGFFQMKSTVKWSDWEGNGLDYCAFCQENPSSSLEGVIIGTRKGDYGAHYFVQTDSHFRTREVRIAYVGGPRLHVTTDGEGRWHDLIRDAAISGLEGCLDVDIGFTPATNTFPLKRLHLEEGASRDIVVAYVPLLPQIEGDFLPRPARQRYTCLVRDQRYLYEGLFRGFKADLEVDASGLVLDYPETFRRIQV